MLVTDPEIPSRYSPPVNPPVAEEKCVKGLARVYKILQPVAGIADISLKLFR